MTTLLAKSLHALPYLGALTITGQDGFSFLQGQVTCDVAQLSQHHASAGALCDAKGRMQATFILLKDGDNYLCILPRDSIAIALKRLKKYALFSKVSLEDVSQQWHFYGMQDKTHDKPSALFNVQCATEIYAIALPSYYSRHLLLSRNNDTLQHYRQQQIAAGFQPDTEQHWQLDNIKNGLADILPALSNLLTPQMINLQSYQGISFKKGCYVGQEIIARTQHLGKLKRRLYLMQSKLLPTPGMSITNASGESRGIIVNASLEHPEQALILAVLEARGLQDDTLFCQDQALTHIKCFE